MPRGYRGIVGATLGLALLISFGLGCYLLAGIYGHYSHQCGGGGNSASYAKQRCPQQVDTHRAGLPYLAQSIASNPEPEDDKERERRDLFAQESAALWGFWSLIVSGISAAITALGTGFLLWQIILTRQAVEDTGDATKAMIDANKIMAIVEDASCVFSISKTHFTPEIGMTFDITVANVGRSAAMIHRITIDIEECIIEKVVPSGAVQIFDEIGFIHWPHPKPCVGCYSGENPEDFVITIEMTRPINGKSIVEIPCSFWLRKEGWRARANVERMSQTQR